MAKWTKKAWIPWLGTFLVVAVWLGYRALNGSSSRLTPITRESVSAAKAKWRAAGVKDYSMDVIITGVQQGNHHIEVKDFKVVSMITDGEPAPAHMWQYWSVDGMFGFLEEELVQAEHPETAFQTADKSKVYLSALFHPELAYPQEYLRQVFGRKLTIEWRIASFTRR